MRVTSYLLIAIGLAIIVYSLARPEGDGGRSNWSAEQAEAKRDAAIRLHELTVGASNDPSVEDMHAVVEAHAEVKRLDDELSSAIDNARQNSTRLRWLGAAVVVVGLGLMLRSRRT